MNLCHYDSNSHEINLFGIISYTVDSLSPARLAGLQHIRTENHRPENFEHMSYQEKIKAVADFCYKSIGKSEMNFLRPTYKHRRQGGVELNLLSKEDIINCYEQTLYCKQLLETLANISTELVIHNNFHAYLVGEHDSCIDLGRESYKNGYVYPSREEHKAFIKQSLRNDRKKIKDFIITKILNILEVITFQESLGTTFKPESKKLSKVAR